MASRVPPAVRNPSRRRQRGSIVVTTVMAMSLIAIVLMGSELAFLFHMKREFQKTADLAALAGAQRLLPSPGVDVCANAKAQATQNAARNMSGIALSTLECGQWAATHAGERHFVAGAADPNALRVTIRSAPPMSILPFFSASRVIGVEALAMLDAPVAAISVTPRLLRTSGDSTLGAALKALGLNIDGSIVAGYEGLATVPLTPGGLLCAIPGGALCPAAGISVANLNALLDTEISLGQLLDAVVVAGGRGDLVATNFALVDAVKARLGVGALTLRLGSATGAQALFATITAPTSQAALQMRMSALDVIRTAVGVASAGRAVDVPSLNMSLLGLASVTAKAGVVEAPSLAIGRTGITAYSAQLRTFIHVRSDDALIGGLLAPLVRLNLPIVLDAVAAQARLEDLCTPALVAPTGEPRATLSATGALAKSCIGRIANASGTQDCATAATAPAYKACFDQLLFSRRQVCDDSLFDMELVNVLGLLKTTNHLRIAALPLGTPNRATLREGETATLGNDLAIGATVSNLVTQATTLLFAGTASAGTPSGASLADIANPVLERQRQVGGERRRGLHRQHRRVPHAANVQRQGPHRDQRRAERAADRRDLRSRRPAGRARHRCRGRRLHRGRRARQEDRGCRLHRAAQDDAGRGDARQRRRRRDLQQPRRPHRHAAPGARRARYQRADTAAAQRDRHPSGRSGREGRVPAVRQLETGLLTGRICGSRLRHPFAAGKRARLLQK